MPVELLNKVTYVKLNSNAITDLLIGEICKTKAMDLR